MVDAVGIRFTAGLAKEWSFSGPEEQRVQAVVQKLQAHYGTLHPMQFTVLEAAPAHQGWGTGTQLALEVALVVLAASRKPWNADEVAQVLGRGNRSGIGIAGYEKPGFYFDPGKTRDGKRLPLERFVLPREWTWVLVEPGQEAGLSAEEERRAFAELGTLSAETAERLHTLARARIIPAISHSDFQGFSQSLTEYNYLAGGYYQSIQHGHYGSDKTVDHIQILKDAGAQCYGQSSWGPGLFTLHPNKILAERFMSKVNLPDCRLLLARSR
jgi:beta-RFAP synthase